MNPDREAERQERVASLLEAFLRQAQSALWSRCLNPAARDNALSFLTKLGFEIQRLKQLPIGLFTDGPSVRQGLENAGFSGREIEASTLIADERLAGRLVGPIRDPAGRILSFWARHPADRPPRLLFKGQWKDQAVLVGLDVALETAGHRQNGQQRLVVFERLFDALLLQSLGFRQAAAMAGPAQSMTRQRWQRLAALGVREATLVPDRADAFSRGFVSAVENALRAGPALDVFVVLPESWDGRSSAVEYVRGQGVAHFRAVLERSRIHGYAYRAMAILNQHRPDTSWTEASRHAAWKEAIEFYATSGPQRIADLDTYFVPTIVAGLGRRWDTFEPTGPAPVPEPGQLLESKAVHPDGVSVRTGANGYCRHHHCDTSVCFCFD